MLNESSIGPPSILFHRMRLTLLELTIPCLTCHNIIEQLVKLAGYGHPIS